MATTKHPTVANARSITRGDLLRVASVLPDSDLNELFVAIANGNNLDMGHAIQRIVLRLNKGNDAVEVLSSLNKFLATVS